MEGIKHGIKGYRAGCACKVCHLSYLHRKANIKYNATSKGRSVLLKASRKFYKAHSLEIAVRNSQQDRKIKRANRYKAEISNFELLQKRKKRVALWKKYNLHKVCAYTAKYNAKKIQATPPWLSKDHYMQIEEIYNMAHSLSDIYGIRYEVDHKWPLHGHTASGLHVPWNLQVMTYSANASKGNRSPELITK